MKLIFSTIVLVLLMAISFSLGMKWEKYRILESDSLELKTPFVLQSEKGKGQLPVGTILYPYSSGPSIDTFVIFVNTKNLNALEPFSFEKPFTMVPLDAYQK
ncbi:hypothetical protein PVT68_05380 [Microbulbifer bruguierae]|uniref:Uncharacterized protein n=1 Tax=Microbulbifer bruguierae TaxID=3029061 RepID=A0ABY8NGJ5_9GAMM|nr:hypothetical protein [Microbulbifer bruguierae]WGL17727.1 hypothetical protein PVT68_05380 [Microbulbifer bruguierae]